MSNINQATVLLTNAGGKKREIGEIPDLWHIAIANKNSVHQQMILEVWHLAHDLKDAITQEREAAINGVRYPKGMEPATVNIDWIPDALVLERES